MLNAKDNKYVICLHFCKTYFLNCTFVYSVFHTAIAEIFSCHICISVINHSVIKVILTENGRSFLNFDNFDVEKGHPNIEKYLFRKIKAFYLPDSGSGLCLFPAKL